MPPQNPGDLSALNADPTAKGRKGYEAERARLARATIELELEMIDAEPERMQLFKRQPKDGACMCDSCTKRRLWIAIRRVDKKQEELDVLDALDDMVAKAYQGEMEVVLECIKKYGPSAVLHQGGPVAVAGYKSAHARAHAGLFFFFSRPCTPAPNPRLVCGADLRALCGRCNECKFQRPEDPCYHCGRAGWMRSRKDMLTSRKDLKTMPTYLIMPLLHAACWGGHVLLATKLIKMGCPVNLQDDMGCTPLHWCTCNGHKTLQRQLKYIAIVEQLLIGGADCTTMDQATKLPVELTQEPNPKFESMRMAILKHAQKPLNDALLKYCQTGDVAMARRCVTAGADLGCGDWLNDTPLHVAITYGHKELIDMLVDRAMEQGRLRELVYAKTVDGQNCFDVAQKWGFKNIGLVLQAYVEKSRILDKVNDIVKGGGAYSIPVHLRGTRLGEEMQKELKRQKSVQSKATRALRKAQFLAKQTAKKEAKREAKLQGIYSKQGQDKNKSQACCVS